jgi:hypothetical protein
VRALPMVVLFLVFVRLMSDRRVLQPENGMEWNGIDL